MTFNDIAQRHISDHLDVLDRLRVSKIDELGLIAARLSQVLGAGGTIFLCGNGGSAADAQHVAAELVGRLRRERQPLSAMALTINTSVLTAIGNDYSFDEIFSRQVLASVTARDALVGISTSGRSANVLKAVAAARSKGAPTVAFTGTPGDPLGSAADLAFRAPSSDTARIQESHLLAWHLICDAIEAGLSDSESGTRSV